MNDRNNNGIDDSVDMLNALKEAGTAFKESLENIESYTVWWQLLKFQTHLKRT